jgi:hypothetical protein
MPATRRDRIAVCDAIPLELDKVRANPDVPFSIHFPPERPARAILELHLTDTAVAEINDVVSLVADGTSTILSACYTTANTYEVRFAVFVGVTGMTVDDLDAAGVFIAA